MIGRLQAKITILTRAGDVHVNHYQLSRPVPWLQLKFVHCNMLGGRAMFPPKAAWRLYTCCCSSASSDLQLQIFPP